MLTIAEIAKRYDLPESTARYYCKRFRKFLPHIGDGKRRRYLEESLPVIETILEEMGNSKNSSAVEAKLESRHKISENKSETIKIPNQNQVTPVLKETISRDFEELFRRQTKAMEQIAETLNILVQQDKKNEPVDITEKLASNESIDNLTTVIEEIRKEVKELKGFQDEAEKIHQQDLEQLRKWLAHLAKEQSKEK